MNNYIKQIIILALMFVGNITAWADETVTLTFKRIDDYSYIIYNGDNNKPTKMSDSYFWNEYSGNFDHLTITIKANGSSVGTMADNYQSATGYTYCLCCNFTTTIGFEHDTKYITHVEFYDIVYGHIVADNYDKNCSFSRKFSQLYKIELTLSDSKPRIDIGGSAVSGIADSYDYTGSAISPVPTSVTLGNTDLTNVTDYTISYTNNLNAGTATMTLTGTGDYKGTWSTTFKINKVASEVNTAPTVGEAITYDGTSRALCAVGEATGGTLQYSTDHETWSNTVPTATTVGNYSVFYRVVGDQNHTDLLSKKAGTVTIGARQTNYGTITVTDGYSSDVSNTAVISDNTDEIIIPADIVVGSVTMERTFTVGKAATVMLPFNIAASKVSGGTFYSFIGVDKNGTTGWEVMMQEVNRVSGTLQAHTPYLFMPSATAMTFNLGGETVTLKANNQQTYSVQP